MARTFETVKGPCRDTHGEVVALIGVFKDITERKLIHEELRKAQDELQSKVHVGTADLVRTNESLRREIAERGVAQDALGESESRYRELVELSPDAIFVHAEGEFLFVNSAAVKLFGATTPDELIGTSAYDVIHREYRALAEGRARQVAAGGEPPFTELKVRRRDGSTVVVEVIAKRINYQGRPAILSIHRDVSERKQAEETLRLTQFALDHAGDAAIWLDRDGHVVYANAASCELLGYSRDELLTLSVSNYDPDVSPDDFVRAFERPDPITFEARHRTKTGKVVPVEVSTYGIRFGDVEIMCSYSRDISERKAIEAERLETQFLLRAMTEGATDGIFIKDVDGRYQMVNASWPALIGTVADQVLGKDDSAIFPAQRARAIMAEDRAIMDSGKIRVFEEVVVEDGVERVLLTTKGPCRDADGALTGLIGVVRDVTEERRTAEALREAHDELEARVRERTADLAAANESLLAAKEEADLASRAKSEFLANTSHELRTPLNAIIGFADMMSGGYVGNLSAKQDEYVSDIRESGAALLEIINYILDLSKIESGKAEVHEEEVDVERAVRVTVRLIKERATAADLRLQTNIGSDLPPLRADERMLKRILLNLLTNAVKFTPAGGEVTVDAFVGEDGAFYLAVKDTGIGIAKKNQVLVMAPFGQVDSKLNRRYRGTGLGLSLVKSMIELHGGSVDLESRFRAGTTVTARFPPGRIVSLNDLARTPNEPRSTSSQEHPG